MLTRVEDMDKNILDVLSGFTVVGSLSSILPEISAILAIIWTVMRMYDWITEKRKGKKNG